MRCIQGLSHETTPLLQRIYQRSEHHRVRQRAHCVLLSFQGYTPKELAHIFHVDRITRAQLLIRGQGQTKQGLKASVDPGEPEV